MRFPFHGLLIIGMLAVVACMQGCAHQPPAAPSGQSPSTPSEYTHTREPVSASAGSPSVSATPPSPPQTAVPSAANPTDTAGITPVVRSAPIEKTVAKPAPKPQPPAPKSVPPPTAVTESPPPVPAVPPEPVESREPVEPPVPVEPDVPVTLEALPILIGGEWTLNASGDACALSTPSVRFDDGQGMSRLQLIFTAQHWLIKTQSDIDLSYSGTGLTVDEGRHFSLEQVVRDTDLIFTKDHAAMTQAFMTARRLDITLGFWPSWPVSETKTITLSLQHFARAHRAWKLCQSLIHTR